MNWFYKQNETQFGPVNSATLQELAACGVIGHDTPVRQSDSAEWVEFHTVTFTNPEITEISPPVLMQFFCPGCGQKISTECESVGQQADCPTCHLQFTIPELPSSRSGPPKLPQSTNANEAKSNASPAFKVNISALCSIVISKFIHHAKKFSFSEIKNGTLKQKLVKSGVLVMVLLVGMCTMTSVFSGKKSKPAGKYPSVDSYDYLQTPAMIKCATCNGAGRVITGCGRCNGQQTIRTASGYVIVCPQCQGGGRAPSTCARCNGKGTVPGTRANILAPSKYPY